jgi:hypothetical protein
MKVSISMVLEDGDQLDDFILDFPAVPRDGDEVVIDNKDGEFYCTVIGETLWMPLAFGGKDKMTPGITIKVNHRSRGD